MRKSLIIFLIIGGIALGFGLFKNISAFQRQEPVNSASEFSIQSNLPVPIVESKVSNPAVFSIPSIGVQNVMVESVGLDKENKMDVPKDSDNVAWYNLGARPGEKGSAVIAGHFDKVTGEPAVFYDINKLKTGDVIKVEDKEGKEFEFVITEIVSYELADFPLEKVFAANDLPRLNLITCEGTFDKTSKLYSHRLVVYSVLKS